MYYIAYQLKLKWDFFYNRPADLINYNYHRPLRRVVGPGCSPLCLLVFFSKLGSPTKIKYLVKEKCVQTSAYHSEVTSETLFWPSYPQQVALIKRPHVAAVTHGHLHAQSERRKTHPDCEPTRLTPASIILLTYKGSWWKREQCVRMNVMNYMWAFWTVILWFLFYSIFTKTCCSSEDIQVKTLWLQHLHHLLRSRYMWIPLWKAKRENKVKEEAESKQDSKR